MNLLAHLHLSDGLPAAAAAGNLLADFLRSLGVEAPAGEFAAGFAPPWRRWGGILLDVAGDYFLTRDWPRYGAVPLRDHVAARLAEIHRGLQTCAPPLPPLAERLRAEEWLLSYGTLDGLRLAFERLARRSPAAAALRGAERKIERRQPELQTAFDEFYPRIRARFGAAQSCAAISP